MKPNLADAHSLCHDESHILSKMSFIMRILILCFLLSFTHVTWSFQCYYTLVKSSCWSRYQVSVEVTNAKTLEKILKVAVPAGMSWMRQSFECNPKDSLIYIAQFKPVFWKGEEDKTYRALKNWILPEKINPGDSAWNVSVCFPNDFAEVPLPPDASGNCSCDFSVIPEIKPAVIK